MSFQDTIAMHKDDQAAPLKQVQAEPENTSANDQTELLASISHEIRTPLNAIMGYAEMLSKTNLDAKQQHYTANIVKSSLTLVDLLNTWLQVTKTPQQWQQAPPARIESAKTMPAPERENAPCKLLVVEDSSMIRDLFMDIFSEDRITILTASSGAKAVELAIAEVPQLIFLDLHLPDTDGWQVAQLLRSTAKTAAIPLIAMTGQLLRAEEYNLYFDDFLQKPFQLKQLRAMVDSWLKGPCSRDAADPSVTLEPKTGSSVPPEHAVAASILPYWNPQLGKLLAAVCHTGSLYVTVELGRLMETEGQAQHCAVMEQTGCRLVSCASEPDIADVEEIISQLSLLQNEI